jgi:hypothetical protein
VIAKDQRKLAAMLSTLSVLATTPASAADRACSPEPVEADAQIRAHWPDLPAAIRAALDGREDLDTCARITVRVDRAGILVGVNLLDGRRASRTVSREEDVVPTLVALLLLPENHAAAPEAAVGGAAGLPASADTAPRGAATVTLDVTGSAPAAEGPPRHLTAVATALPSAPSSATPSQHTRFRLELSLATGGRAGDGYRGLALGAITMFDVGGWLFGLQGAGAQYEHVDGGPGTSSLLLAVLGGRRFRFEAPSTVSIDLAAGPALAVRGFGTRYAVHAQAGSTGGQTPPPADDGPWVRLVASAHVSLRARSVVRPFAGVDGEVAIGTWADTPDGTDPRLPTWTMGVVIGATVGTP